MSVQYFLRQPLFTVGDLVFVHDLTAKTNMSENWSDETAEFVNQLYGLNDGYLYDSLMDNAKRFLSVCDLMDLRKLVEKIKSDIEEYGELSEPPVK